MTDIEYGLLMADMQLAWGQPVEEQTVKLWWEKGYFADIAYEDAKAAIAALLATSRWIPYPADIRRWLAEHANPAMDAVWAEVWAELLEARDSDQPWSRVPWSAAVEPFVRHVTLAALGTIAPWSDTPEDVAQAQLRKRWEEWRAREVERLATDGLPEVRAFRERRIGGALAEHHPGLAEQAASLARRRALTD